MKIYRCLALVLLIVQVLSVSSVSHHDSSFLRVRAVHPEADDLLLQSSWPPSWPSILAAGITSATQGPILEDPEGLPPENHKTDEWNEPDETANQTEHHKHSDSESHGHEEGLSHGHEEAHKGGHRDEGAHEHEETHKGKHEAGGEGSQEANTTARHAANASPSPAEEATHSAEAAHAAHEHGEEAGEGAHAGHATHEAGHAHEERAHGHGHEEEAHGHGHGHGEEAHGHKHEVERESLSLAFLLMGGVGAFMVVFHFANSRVLDIKLSVWRVLNMTVSIFAAVLLYGIIKAIIISVFEPSVYALIIITLVMFVVMFVGAHYFLYKLKSGDVLEVKASGIILAHICGFAGMYGLADVREVKLIEELGSLAMIALILFSGVLISGLIYVMDYAMKETEEADEAAEGGDAVEAAEREEEDEIWIDTCEEMDDDVFCLAISFSIVLWFRYLIRGHLGYEPGTVGAVTQWHASALLACSVLFAILVCVGAFVMKQFESSIEHGSVFRRISSNFQHLNSMIMAWAFLFWAEWQLYVWGWDHTTIGGCLVIAIFLTMFSFLAVLGLNYVQEHFRDSKMMKRAMGSLELSLGVLVGFSWERAFDVGFEEINLKYEETWYGPMLVILMSLALFLIVFPAWRLHILTKVMQLETELAKLEQAKAEEKPDAPSVCRGRASMFIVQASLKQDQEQSAHERA